MRRLFRTIASRPPTPTALRLGRSNLTVITVVRAGAHMTATTYWAPMGDAASNQNPARTENSPTSAPLDE